MRWKIRLIAEVVSGETTEAEIATIEREDLLSPATTGLTIAEGKTILEGLQKRTVAAQVEHHDIGMKACFKCGVALRTKGHYNFVLRTVLRQCADARLAAPWVRLRLRFRKPVGDFHQPQSGHAGTRIPYSQTALMPFGKVADFLSELLPLSTKTPPGHDTQPDGESRPPAGNTSRSNSDSMPDDGERYRAELEYRPGSSNPQLTRSSQSALVKKQQMRWNLYTVQRLLYRSARWPTICPLSLISAAPVSRGNVGLTRRFKSTTFPL